MLQQETFGGVTSTCRSIRSNSGPEILSRYLLICSALQWHSLLSSPSWPQGQGFIALLQFVPIQLKSLKPRETDFEPQTLGEHLIKRRLEMKLTQKEVAEQFGVVPWTILNWEKGHTEPPIVSIPAILRFLGYDPFPEPKTLPNSCSPSAGKWDGRSSRLPGHSVSIRDRGAIGSGES